MSRPVGSEAIDLDDLLEHFDGILEQGEPPFQWMLVDRAGCSVGGLRKFLERHGLTWTAFKAQAIANYGAVKGRRACAHCGETDDMKAVYVPLDQVLSDALLRAARRSERHPRVEARRLLREALERNGDLPHRPRAVERVA